MKGTFASIQKLGKTFMLPIALLPLAGLFLGIGASITGEAFVNSYNLQWLLGEGTILFKIFKVLTASGEVIFGNLALLFAISVALGLAKKAKEVAALSAVVAYFVMFASMTMTLQQFGSFVDIKNIDGLIGTVLGFQDTLNPGVFGGIIVGSVVAYLHNRFYKIQLPDSLSFFGGTHFVPIASAFAGVILGVFMAILWPFVGIGIASLGQFIAKSGPFGEFLYGYIYRALIPFGLHHVFYLPFWQTILGGAETVEGVRIVGAQNIVFAQLKAGVPISPDAAKYFSFAFPMMIFGFPAAALAMYHTAKPEKKKEAKGLLFSASLTSILTGITEPIEFSILFAAPFLYFGVNAVLAGLSVIIVKALGIGVGFTFSAGLIDFILYGILPGESMTHWIPIIFMGIIWGLIYYFLFKFCILKFNLKTPGREDEEEDTKLVTKKDYLDAKNADGSSISKEDALSAQIVDGLGGKANIEDVTNCATRLRVTVIDPKKVNQSVLKQTGASGLMVSGKGVQVIYGTKVSNIATNVEEYLEKI